MAGVKGRSGTNKGKDKPWADALRVVVNRDDDKGRKLLMKIAEACASAAAAGDMQAVKEIGDRLDGRAHQTIEASGEIEHRFVARVPNKAADPTTWQKQHAPKTETIQ
jgi:hypothetical protein